MHGQHGLKSGWSQMGWSTVWVSSTAIRVCQSSGIIMSETLEASHVVECIEKAKKIRRITHPLIIHADRGCQYVSDAFRKATEGMVNSYSKKAYPWDNACIESFHALLKREWINRFKIFNYRHAYKLVFEYIETFYNTVRMHSHCIVAQLSRQKSKIFIMN